MRPLNLSMLALILVAVFSGCQDEERQRDAEPSGSTPAREQVGGNTYMGREIAPVRGGEQADWFDRPDREHSELPDRLIRALPIDSFDVVADIGAGTGYFTFRLSEVVSRGRVLAVDIDPAMLAIIAEKSAEKGIANVDLIESSPSDPRLPDESVDLALIVDSYHEFSHPREMLAGIQRGLREGGYLIIVEYRGEDATIDVDPRHRMTEEQIRLEVEAGGYEWVETRDFLPQQHVVIFRRPAR